MSIARLAARNARLRRPILGGPATARQELPYGYSPRWSSTGPATIVDRGFWRSLVPKPLRKENRTGSKGKKSKEWNPATFFIVMFLFVGSMSIQMIALRNQSERYNRQASVKLGQLREALRKLQNGEPVDVDRLLGENVEGQEADWEEILKAIQIDEAEQKTREMEKLKLVETPDAVVESSTSAAHDKTEELKSGEAQSTTTDTKPASLGNFF